MPPVQILGTTSILTHKPPNIASPTFKEDTLADIESFLYRLLAPMQQRPPPERGPGRPRILPALALWAGLLVCVLHGFSSQLSLWRLLSQKGLWFFPRFRITDQAVYARLEKDGAAPLQTLFQRIQQLLSNRLKPMVNTTLASFATAVVSLDTTTLDKIARKLPRLRGLPAGDEKLLAGKLAAIFDIRSQQWREVQFIPQAHQNDKVTARDLVGKLGKGALVLADMGYFGFPWFDWLTGNGYWWISRLRAKSSYEVIHRFYHKGDTFDGIVWLGAYRADKAAHAVRLVCFFEGGDYHRYITNVLDPEVLSMQDIATLYARRWDIEMAVCLVKRRLGLHLLWSAKEVVVQQQIWAVLIIAQILQGLRLEIAYRAGVDPFEVSMGLLVEYLPRYAAQGDDPIKIFVEQGRELRFIRASRRVKIKAPEVRAEQMRPLPEGTVLVRTARYAHRNCTSRSLSARN